MFIKKAQAIIKTELHLTMQFTAVLRQAARMLRLIHQVRHHQAARHRQALHPQQRQILHLILQHLIPRLRHRRVHRQKVSRHRAHLQKALLLQSRLNLPLRPNRHSLQVVKQQNKINGGYHFDTHRFLQFNYLKNRGSFSRKIISFRSAASPSAKKAHAAASIAPASFTS